MHQKGYTLFSFMSRIRGTLFSFKWPVTFFIISLKTGNQSTLIVIGEQFFVVRDVRVFEVATFDVICYVVVDVRFCWQVVTNSAAENRHHNGALKTYFDAKYRIMSCSCYLPLEFYFARNLVWRKLSKIFCHHFLVLRRFRLLPILDRTNQVLKVIG